MTTFNNGINSDIAPRYQPDGTYRYALNAVLETSNGLLPSISSEVGNLAFGNLPSGKTIIGHTLTDNEDVILFLYSPDDEHEIGILNSISGNYTTHLIGACLNFSLDHQINAIFRIKRGCDRVVYFTDLNNPYRSIDFSDTSYIDSITKQVSSCNFIKFTRPFKFPCFSVYSSDVNLRTIDEGGVVQPGVYYFAIRYLDKYKNPTNFSPLTRGIPVGFEDYELSESDTTYNFYQGASNVPTSPYKGSAGKKIGFRMTNVDPQFPYFQIAVVKRTGDGGEISGVDILTETPFTSQTVDYVYTGTESTLSEITNLTDVLVGNAQIQTVVAHAQTLNRLFVGGITEPDRDYSGYQRFASKIKTEWVKTSVNTTSAKTKQPFYYFGNGSSFMDDEIYALGVFYTFDDGTQSPVFHIPGRPADVSITGSNPYIGTSGVATDGNAWDTGSLFGDIQTEFDTNKTLRWERHSTATQYGTQLKGLMGYYETSTTYPTIENCEGDEDYWGVDWTNTPITTSDKIRHHRMPSSELRDAGLGAEGFRTGVLFSNVQLPPGATRCHFVYGDRTFEKTILAKGVFIPLDPGDAEFEAATIKPKDISSAANNLNRYAFISSDILFREKRYAPDYVRLEKVLRDPQWDLDPTKNYFPLTPNTYQKYDTVVNTEVNIFGYRQYITPENANYPVYYYNYAPKTALGTVPTVYSDPLNVFDFQNSSYNIDVLYLNLARQFDDFANNTDTHVGGSTGENEAYYGSLKLDVEVFSDLFSITYNRMSSCSGSAPSTIHYGGDTFMNQLSVTDYEFTQTTGPDYKESKIYFINFLTQDDSISEFRNGSYEGQYSFMRWNFRYTAGQFRRHLEDKYWEPEDDIMSLYPEVYEFNNSYSFQNSPTQFYPIPRNYQFCSDCRGKFSHRIYYSELDQTESTSDNYRIFKVNNYKDLDGAAGSITDMFLNFEQLYITTTNSIYFAPTRPQSIETSESSLYIGTGEVLSIPFKQLKNTDYAFGGCSHFKGRIGTEYGTLYIDDLSSRPLLLDTQLNDISLSGLRNFFQENGSFKLDQQFQELYKKPYTIRSTSSPSGIGYILTYDPRYKRVIIHKRDFKIRQETLSGLVFYPMDEDISPIGPLTPDTIWFNNFSFYKNPPTYPGAGTPLKLSLRDSNYFENHSFTVSYSFMSKSFASFHSYHPDYAFNNYDTFFTNSLYKHTGPYQNFYGTKYPHIIDLSCKSDALQKTFTNIFYTSNTYGESPNEYSVNATFDSIIAYNNSQSTGNLNLDFKDSAFESPIDGDTAIVAKVDNLYRINYLRDQTLSNNAPIWDFNRNNIPFYLDKVPFLPNLGTIDQFQQKRLKDYYLGVRLSFNPLDNYKIVTDSVFTNQITNQR